MPQPLLLADTPHLLYRGFFALPDTINGADGRPVNALLGSVNQLLWCVERYEPRAVVCCFGQEAAHYRTELYPPYHAHRPPMPDDLAHQWEKAPALYEALGWTVTVHDALEADDLMHAFARRRSRRAGARRSSPATATCSSARATGSRSCSSAPARRGPTRWARPRSRSATGSRRRSCRTSSRCAATRPTGCRARRGSARRPPPTCSAATAASRRAIAGAIREKPSVRRALLEQADELRAFKDIATLRDADVERPPDRADRPRGRRRGGARARHGRAGEAPRGRRSAHERRCA